MMIFIDMNNNNNYKKVTEYADTAYNGKANPYYRENIAQRAQRKRHLAKWQSKLGVFPRVKITGICWDSYQALNFNKDITGTIFDIDSKLNIKPEQLRLALSSQSQNLKEVMLSIWKFSHAGAFFGIPVFMLIGLVLGGVQTFMEHIDILWFGLAGLLMSKYLYRLLDKFNLIPTGQYVIFNRQTGMIEIANDERTGYHHLPFEQFNAHHRTVHNPKTGAPYYGFTLLHYKEDLMYQNTDYPSVEGALAHWELIKNFMDTTTPLADIPQFERYRLYDPTTATYDRKHGRPANFWRRVDKKFMKKVAKASNNALYSFPVKQADTLHEALQHGYKVPDIVYFPWREAEVISDTFIEYKTGVFGRYFVEPFMF
ncbi:hypothetical protein [Litorilituus sediminis]|uniref:Uncharacterized protein n=1 Tax=Litorilituus sediminis TaxID=718192 RepID=A0A4P6P633_9GAMM|nr:hypothetical protein [Litorilituus sediminis]QBG34897.1 hypothetical protein EMK97_03680 [Litorilituus sediminis]